MSNINESFENLSGAGYAVLRNLCSSESLRLLDSAFSETMLAESDHTRKKKADAYAMRNILRQSEVITALESLTGLKKVVREHLGECIAVRGIYFDKPFRANWSVPWHQDLTIAVEDRAEKAGFKSWTNKAGVFHVEPPVSILNTMVTARIHLDDADAGNGALCIIPESHSQGHIPVSQVREIVKKQDFVRCDVKRGDVMLMKPLLLHSSRSSETNRRRRVVHIEFSATTLPTPLKWQDRIILA